MARERADDYDQKVRLIKDAAAELFAQTGYPGAKLLDVARACGASKSMLYHYFPTKDDLLFSMIEEHLQEVLAALQEVDAVDLPVKKKFPLFLQHFQQKSSETRQRNMVAMNEAKYLPEKMQKKLLKLEKQIVELVVKQIKAVNPKLDDGLYKVYAMLLIGMLNWTDTWYNPNGPIKPEELVERTTSLFLNGFMKVS